MPQGITSLRRSRNFTIEIFVSMWYNIGESEVRIVFRKRNVKYASQVKRTSCVKCALRHIRQTSHHCDQREQHHFERSEKHHIAAGDASFDKQLIL